jgi:ubiquinol-cytochrome c reductase cytochrome b subunit
MQQDSQPVNQPNPFEKVVEFVDERVGLKTIQAKMLNEPIPGGSRWAYAFGSVLLFIFILQVVTGILLMFYYVPSTDHAYDSTQYIIHEVDYGWFLLSYHFWGSSAMVVMVFAHMSQVFLWGAYKKPRELIWLVGLALFGIVMGFGFTGYLLPWDQRACEISQGRPHSRSNDVESIFCDPCDGSACRPSWIGGPSHILV